MSIRMKVATVTFAGMLALSAVGLAGAAKQEKVYICHHTASETNPVVIIHVGKPAEKGHLGGEKETGNQPHNKNSHLSSHDESSEEPPTDCGQGCGQEVCAGVTEG